MEWSDQAKATIMASMISAIAAIIVAAVTTYTLTPKKIINLFNKNLPAGSIVASMAKYEDLVNLSGIKGKWIPADGREVPDAYNSEYYKVTKLTSVPDLRGMFIRGLNEFERNKIKTGDLCDPDKDINDKDRIAGSVQADSLKKHKHNMPKIVFDSGAVYGLTVAGGNTYGFSWQGHSNTPIQETTFQTVVKEETRPKNVSLYYYIKIN